MALASCTDVVAGCISAFADCNSSSSNALWTGGGVAAAGFGRLSGRETLLIVEWCGLCRDKLPRCKRRGRACGGVHTSSGSKIKRGVNRTSMAVMTESETTGL